MLGKIFGILTTLSFITTIFTGKAEAVASAVLDGAADAISLTISLSGIMCLWCGIMAVLREAGIIGALARGLHPFLRIFFPHSCGKDNGEEEIAANISANLLGIGNAATPLALSALKKMQKNNPHPHIPTADMITLTVMNTASASLLPTTILSLRRAAGSEDAFSVLIPIWLVSFTCWLLALTLCRLWGAAAQKADVPSSRHDT